MVFPNHLKVFSTNVESGNIFDVHKVLYDKDTQIILSFSEQGKNFSLIMYRKFFKGFAISCFTFFTGSQSWLKKKRERIKLHPATISFEPWGKVN